MYKYNLYLLLCSRKICTSNSIYPVKVIRKWSDCHQKSTIKLSDYGSNSRIYINMLIVWKNMVEQFYSSLFRLIRVSSIQQNIF